MEAGGGIIGPAGMYRSLLAIDRCALRRMRMRGFVVVDLFTQADYVPQEIRTPPERFVAWLRQYGRVETWPVYRDGQVKDVYAFRSASDLEATFWFDDAGELHIGHDESVIRRVFRREGILIRHG